MVPGGAVDAAAAARTAALPARAHWATVAAGSAAIYGYSWRRCRRPEGAIACRGRGCRSSVRPPAAPRLRIPLPKGCRHYGLCLKLSDRGSWLPLVPAPRGNASAVPGSAGRELRGLKCNQEAESATKAGSARAQGCGTGGSSGGGRPCVRQRRRCCCARPHDCKCLHAAAAAGCLCHPSVRARCWRRRPRPLAAGRPLRGRRRRMLPAATALLQSKVTNTRAPRIGQTVATQQSDRTAWIRSRARGGAARPAPRAQPRHAVCKSCAGAVANHAWGAGAQRPQASSGRRRRQNPGVPSVTKRQAHAAA